MLGMTRLRSMMWGNNAWNYGKRWFDDMTKVLLQGNTNITQSKHSECTCSWKRTSQYESVFSCWANNVERTADQRTERMYQCRCV